MVCKQKYLILATLTLLMQLVFVSAQWYETTIYVPDSLCGIRGPGVSVYDSINNKIYVGGVGDQTRDFVVVIDGATNEKIARIPVGSGVSSLCHNTTNNKVYCANYSDNTVTVIDGASNSVLTTITTSDGPGDLVYNPTNNKIYCANYSSDNVTVIDGATNSVATTVTVGSGPCAMVHNSLSNKIYCANYYSNDVTVIDGASNSVITTIEVEDEPRALTWNPAQNRTYVANYSSSSISVICDSLTGIEELMQNASPSILDIYPNPTKMALTIRSSVPLRGVKVYDILGELVETVAMTKPENTTTISMRNLSAGVYFVKVNAENAEIIRKIVVTR